MGFVTGPSEQLAVDEALGHQHGVSVGLLPIIGKAVAAESEHAAGEVGAVRSGQDQLSGVVSDEREAAATLGDVPAEPSLAILEVVGRSAPTQQSDPPAIHLGDIAEVLANQSVALEVVRLFHQLAETRTQQGIRGGK
jgi:hypothetical protein